MRTAIQIPEGIGRRSFVRRHAAAVLVAATSLVLVRSAIGSVPSAIPGEATCRNLPTASTIAYETGVACPPEDFAETMGYEPVLIQTSAGWRYVRPAWADGGCSGPLADDGPFWDFSVACRAHDYGYDLVRFGIGDRGSADELLYRDMKHSCARNAPLGVHACKTLADSAHAVLWVGDVSPGFEPRPL
jgi:hypothetical protein